MRTKILTSKLHNFLDKRPPICTSLAAFAEVMVIMMVITVVLKVLSVWFPA